MSVLEKIVYLYRSLNINPDVWKFTGTDGKFFTITDGCGNNHTYSLETFVGTSTGPVYYNTRYENHEMIRAKLEEGRYEGEVGAEVSRLKQPLERSQVFHRTDRVNHEVIKYSDVSSQLFRIVKKEVKGDSTFYGLSGISAMAETILGRSFGSLTKEIAIYSMKGVFIDMSFSKGYHPLDALLFLEAFCRGAQAIIASDYESPDIAERPCVATTKKLTRNVASWEEITKKSMKFWETKLHGKGQFVEIGKIKISVPVSVRNTKDIYKSIGVDGRTIPSSMFKEYKRSVENNLESRLSQLSFDDEEALTSLPDFSDFLEVLYPTLKPAYKRMILRLTGEMVSDFLTTDMTLTSRRSAIMFVMMCHGVFIGKGSEIEMKKQEG